MANSHQRAEDAIGTRKFTKLARYLLLV